MSVLPQKYQRCLVMAGGGFRFSYYLGVYAALCRAGKQPDILLASCGGAIAAAIIQILPDDAQRKQWMRSAQMHQFWCSLKANTDTTIAGALLAAGQRRFFSRGVKWLPDLFRDYMFELPDQLPLPPQPEASELAVAIIAGKLLYTEEEVGQLRGDRKLFAETVFGDERIASLLRGIRSHVDQPHWSVNSGNAIADNILTEIGVPLSDAARASISDMVYFRCHSFGRDHYVGGVIDLFPIEIAHALADQVMMELKGPYDNCFGLPAVRAVLGIDGNRRLQHVLNHPADLWFDTSDMTTALAKGQIDKKVNWWRNRIDIVVPASYADYVTMIDAQWEYGYQRGEQAVNNEASGS